MKNQVILFDVFKTLITFDGDHVEPETFEFLEKWLGYRGIAVAKETLMHLYQNKLADRLNYSPSDFTDVETLDVWSDVLETLGIPPYQRRLMSIEIALIWRQITTRHIDVYPRTFEMLDACQKAGFRLAVASNTQRAYTEHELNMLGLSDYFELILFSSDIQICKPDPRIFETALHRLNVCADDVLYVGDNPYDDVLGAHSAGIRTILLERGTPMKAGLDKGIVPYATIHNNEVEKVAELATLYFNID